MLNSIEYIMRELHPVGQDAFRRLTRELQRRYTEGKTWTYFRPFEGLRSPLKQDALFKQRPAVTTVGPWHSPHQYGLAVDFVPVRNGQAVIAGNAQKCEWSWDGSHDWGCLRQCAEYVGLLNVISWDKPHVEHPLWRSLFPLIKGGSDLSTTVKG